MVFSGGNFTWGSVIDWEAMKGTFTIDPAKKLKELDLTFARDGKMVTGKCIYILEGDLLKVCYSEPDRPTAFKDVTPNFPRIYLWKRQKAEDQKGEGKDGAAKKDPKQEVAAFSPDGARVAVAGGKAISVFETKTGKVLFKMIGHTEAVTALAFSADGKVLASGGNDRMICLWDGAVGKQISSIRAPNPAKAITFTGDGKTVVVHEADQTIREFDIATGKEIRVTKAKEKK
jgi:hypothetical protein